MLPLGLTIWLVDGLWVNLERKIVVLKTRCHREVGKIHCMYGEVSFVKY